MNASLSGRSRSRATVEVMVLGGFVVALALLVIGGIYTYRATVQYANSVEWVVHTQRVRATLAALFGEVVGTEIALRDYLLTKDDAYRQEYERQLQDIPRRLVEVDSLIGDNPVQQRHLAALQPIVAALTDDIRDTSVAYAAFGLAAARAVMAERRGKNANAREARTLLEAMEDEETRLLAARESAASNVRQTTLISLFVTLFAATATFVALFRGIHREMGARRAAVRALRVSEQYNRSIVDSSPDSLGVLDLDARLIRLTPQGCRLMEVTDIDALAGLDWLSWWKEGEDRQAAQAAVLAARGGQHGRFQGFCATQRGTPKWWDVIVMPILGADGRPASLLAVSRDISDRKRAEQDLHEANHFLDSLIENLPVSISVKDAATRRIVRQNREVEAMTGIPREFMAGKTDHQFLTEDEAAKALQSDDEALLTGKLHVAPEHSFEHRQLGQRTIRTMRVPIPDPLGHPQFLVTIGVDVTQERLTELAMQELNAALEAKAAQLEITNKELESFSYSVSHDLRAPLRAIDGFALMIEEDYQDSLDAEGRRYLKVIRENSRRMGALIDDLLAFSRLGRLPVASHEVNVEALVREVVQEVLDGRESGANAAATPPQIAIGPLPAARGDRGLLRQVWTNLISNAVKYSSKVARPHIEVQGHVNGRENLYSVRDNGVGFNMDYVEKLFGVFQRLHRVDEFDGTGVGLAIVHRVVSRHGGRVWAEGRMGEGAVFSFALPKEDACG